MGFYGVSIRHLQRYTVVLARHNEDSFWVTREKARGMQAQSKGPVGVQGYSLVCS